MYTENAITILQVGNGWLVNIPRKMEHPIGMPTEEELRRQARIFKDEYEGDDLLKEIRKGNDYENVKTDESGIFTFKEESIFVFKNFKDVLEFLAKKIIDDKK